MEWLFKIFIKNKDEIENPQVRNHYGVFSGIVGIVLNVILFGIKLAAGLLSGSIGIIADAVNNIGDAGSSVITLVGFRLAGKPVDNEHPFGHGRFEYLSALFVSIAIILMGFELGKSSVGKIINPQTVEFTGVSFMVLVVAIVVKGLMFKFNRHVGEKINSESLRATAKDSLSDAVSTGAVLAGALIARFVHINIDGYVGFLVSTFIMYTGICAVQDAVSPLLGQAPDPEFVREIEEMVMSHEYIVGIHDMVIHDYGPTRRMVSLHAEMPADTDIIKMHDDIDHIERELKEKFGCDAVIHLDPIETNNEVVNRCREITGKVISEISEELTFHDFRVVSGPTHTNLIFDVVVPHGFAKLPGELEKEILQGVRKYDETYNIVVVFDAKFTNR